MRLTVIAGRQKLLIPIESPDKTISWLATDIGRRLAKFQTESSEPVYSIDLSGPTKNIQALQLQQQNKIKNQQDNNINNRNSNSNNNLINTSPQPVPIRELRTSSNHRLDPDDQIIDVLTNNDVVVAITGKTYNDDVEAGDMVAQYYIHECIGEGTFGRVFKANDLNLNRQVAIKVLKKDKATEVSTRRFLREAELNGRLSYSPHIVTVYDFGRTSTGILYIVMELLHGRPLGDLIDERIEQQKPFDVLECIHIISPVLRGLQAAHTHNPPIIHRDLKPDNIWLNENAIHNEINNDNMIKQNNNNNNQNQEYNKNNNNNNDDDINSSDPLDYASKIMDFGIAIPSELWHDTLACGTRMYSSPEQVRRKYKLDGRSDIYSVGVILYQMLSLCEDVPFDPIDINLGQVIPDIREYTVTPITDHMANIVMKALCKYPHDRWNTAEQMCDELHKEEAALLSYNPPKTIKPKKKINSKDAKHDSEIWNKSPQPPDINQKDKTKAKILKQDIDSKNTYNIDKQQSSSSSQQQEYEQPSAEPYLAPSFRDQDIGGGVRCECKNKDCKCECIHCCCNKHRNRQRHYQRMLRRRPQKTIKQVDNNNNNNNKKQIVRSNKTIAISML